MATPGQDPRLASEFHQLLDNLSPRRLNLRTFSTVWRAAFGKGAPPPTRVNVVGTKEALSKWSSSSSSSSSSSAANNKKGSKKKKKGKKKLEFAEHVYPVVYDPLLNEDRYDDDDEEEEGDPRYDGEGCVVKLDMDMPPGVSLSLLFPHPHSCVCALRDTQLTCLYCPFCCSR